MLTVWFFVYKKLAQFAVRGALPPRRLESPGCAADNKPSCVLHLLGSFIGSRGFSSLEQRPEFWVLQMNVPSLEGAYLGKNQFLPKFPTLAKAESDLMSNKAINVDGEKTLKERPELEGVFWWWWQLDFVEHMSAYAYISVLVCFFLQ